MLGSITRGPVRDRFSHHDALERIPGPFVTTKEFNDWFQYAALPYISVSEMEDPYRPFLPDDDHIYFTHADLHLGNIMVSKSPGVCPRITSVIDWEEAGWYPSYWECCKMALVVDDNNEVLTTGCVDKVSDPVLDTFATYWSWRGYI